MKNLSVPIAHALWILAIVVSVMKLMKACPRTNPFESNPEGISSCLECNLGGQVLPLFNNTRVWYVSGSQRHSTQRSRDGLDKGPHHSMSPA